MMMAEIFVKQVNFKPGVKTSEVESGLLQSLYEYVEIDVTD